MGGVGEGRHGLGGAGFGLPFPTEEVLRTIGRNAFEKIGKCREAFVAVALVVERSGTQEIELRTMIGEAIDLAVVQLDGADRLVPREAGKGRCAQTTIAGVAC